MTLQLLHSEFPLYEDYLIFFFICVATQGVQRIERVVEGGRGVCGRISPSGSSASAQRAPR
jgi:hypothetical protein